MKNKIFLMSEIRSKPRLSGILLIPEPKKTSKVFWASKFREFLGHPKVPNKPRLKSRGTHKDFLMNKKGVVGETLTWFTAFIIIFFVMFLFFLSSFFIYGKTREFKIEETKDKILLAKNLGSFMKMMLPVKGVELKLIASFLMEKQDALPNNIKIFINDYLISKGKNVFDLLRTYKKSGAVGVLPKIKFRR
jgi:hypothetical protein